MAVKIDEDWFKVHEGTIKLMLFQMELEEARLQKRRAEFRPWARVVFDTNRARKLWWDHKVARRWRRLKRWLVESSSQDRQ